MQAESTCGVCHALNLQRSFGNHWRIFKTAARYNDPVYDLEGSSAAFRITHHAGEKIDIEGAVIPAFTWAGGGHGGEDNHEIYLAVSDLVESEPTC